MMGTTYSEKRIEEYLSREVSARGGLCLKYFNPAMTGYPDRLCMLPGGVTFWVELKSPGKKPRRVQELRHKQLAGLGQSVHVADSPEGVDSILSAYDEGRWRHEV